MTLLHSSAAISKPITGRGHRGVRNQAYDAPGFTIVLQGGAWLAFDGTESIRLGQGDFLSLPTMPAFTLSSAQGVATTPAQRSVEAVRHGEQEDEPDVIALGRSFAYERINALLLLGLLPLLIPIPASQGRTTRLGRLIDLLAEECATNHPGKELILSRMLERF